jgi:hypothetical protein
MHPRPPKRPARRKNPKAKRKQLEILLFKKALLSRAFFYPKGAELG